MAAETGNNRFFRKPNVILWTATVMVTLYAVWCVVLLILTASGYFVDSQSYDCGNTEDLVTPRWKKKLVYLWSGLSLVVCVLLLLEFWRRNGYYVRVSLCVTTVLFLIMLLSFGFREKEEQVIKEFEERYLALLPLNNAQNQSDTISNSTRLKLSNVYHWQAQFNCCGLRSYRDWGADWIPASCMCEREDHSFMCVAVGNSTVYKKFNCSGLQGYRDWESWIRDSSMCDREDSNFRCVDVGHSSVYEFNCNSYRDWGSWIQDSCDSLCVDVGNSTVYKTPCLSTVLSRVKKRSATFWAIMISWVPFLGVPVNVFILCVGATFLKHCYWTLQDIYLYITTKKIEGGEETVPVVLIRKNNNQTEEESGKDGEAKESGSNEGLVFDVDNGTNMEGEGRGAEDEVPLRLQGELDPPPVQRQCRCKFNFFVLEESSPLVHSGAVQVEASNPMSTGRGSLFLESSERKHFNLGDE